MPATGDGKQTLTDEVEQEEAQSGPARPKRLLKPSTRVCGPEWINYLVRLLVNDRKFSAGNSIFLSHQTSQQ